MRELTYKLTWVPSAMVVVVGMLAIGAIPVAANPAWTKKERKQCVYCHVGAWDSGKYTEAGQYYKSHEFSFNGYVPKGDAGKAQVSDKKVDDKH